MAIVGGIVWGAISAATGYISILVALFIGYGVSWALVKGGGTFSSGMIALGFLLTVFAVFVGDIVALSIIAAPYGATPVDVLVHYPEIVAEFPGDTLPNYVFGLFGAAYAGYSLWQTGKKARTQAQMPPPYVPAPLAPSGAPASAPQVRVLDRKATQVTLEVTLADPVHVLRAFYTTMTGRAEVYVDGILAGKTRVWGPAKEIPVALAGGRSAMVRFHGQIEPHIDVFLDGRPIATA